MDSRRRRYRLPSVLAAVTLFATIGPVAQETTVVRGRVEIGIPIAARRPTNAYGRTMGAPKLAPESEQIGRAHV